MHLNTLNMGVAKQAGCRNFGFPSMVSGMVEMRLADRIQGPEHLLLDTEYQ
jgi:hypothetical protein